MTWFGKYFGRFFGGRFFGRWPPGDAAPAPAPVGPNENVPDSRTGMAGGINPASAPWIRWPGLVREFVWRSGAPGEAQATSVTAQAAAGRVVAVGVRSRAQSLPALRARLGDVTAEGEDRDEKEFLAALEAGVFDDLLDDEDESEPEPYVYDEARELAVLEEVLDLLDTLEEEE